MDELGASDCEALREGLIAQPANSWSSLAFVVAAVWLARRSRAVEPPRRALAVAYAATVAANGVGSWLFHGPGTTVGKWLHDGAIVAAVAVTVVTIPAGVREWRSVRAGRRPPPWVGAGVFAVLLATGVVVNALSRTGAAWCRPDAVL